MRFAVEKPLALRRRIVADGACLSVVGTILCTQLTKGPNAVVINMVDSHMDDDRHMDDDSRNRRSTRADSFCG
jgi:hypothetical protein